MQKILSMISLTIKLKLCLTLKLKYYLIMNKLLKLMITYEILKQLKFKEEKSNVNFLNPFRSSLKRNTYIF